MSSLDRRAFLGTVAGAVAGMTVPAVARTLADGRIERLGVQLYTVRDLLRQDFAGTLSGIAAIGYREVEFAGYQNQAPGAVRAVLDRYGLNAPSAHVAYESIDAGWDEVLQAARVVGHRYVVVAWIPEERRGTLDDWKRIGEQLNRAATACRAAGLQFAYHNHSFEFEKLEGKLPYDVLVEATDASLVQLELDLFWITKGGADPLAYFARFPGRFPLVHVKDITAGGDMVEAGKGVIDWRRLFARRAEAGIRHYFVEHDQPRDPLASIRTSYQYLRRLEL
ncbi:MAG: sugar phosphate isomerase/epimerase family protein [Gemmatimonadales bacterium]